MEEGVGGRRGRGGGVVEVEVEKRVVKREVREAREARVVRVQEIRERERAR